MNMGLGGLWELVMDREAWYAVIHGVTKSQTRLSDWTELNAKCWPKPNILGFSFLFKPLCRSFYPNSMLYFNQESEGEKKTEK